ncbi:MAG: NAD-dependent epimerase/dehydratase family protein [Bacteroidia bacterium]|nr:NAD-dependent epimerase/dehydratase family protein [Bacteroidia bacterium]
MILLTGATGFLGRYIADELLAAGYELRLLVRHAAQRKLPWGGMAEIAEGDLTDLPSLEDAVRGADAVVHAAARVSFRRRDAQAVMQDNVQGTAHLVDLCLEHRIPKLVYVSSIAACGRSRTEAITEQTPWQPGQESSAYARSKRKAELEVQRGVAEGLQAAIVNPAVILGAGDWTQGTPRLFSAIDRGLPLYNPGINGWVAAADVARACRLLLEQDLPSGERYLLSAGNHSYREVLGWIAAALGKPAPRVPLPRPLGLLAGWAAESAADLAGREPFVTLETMRSGSLSYRYDGSKITRLGFAYTPVQEAVRAAAAQYLARNS